MRKEDSYMQQESMSNDTFNIREEIEKYLIYWKWFVFGAALSIFIAWTYLRYTAPTYSASASILIKDNKKSGISAEFEAFKDLGIIGGGSLNNTDNEIEILKSRKIIGSVVDSLNLDINYFIEGRVISSEVYGIDRPFIINFIKKDTLLHVRDTTFSIQTVDNKSFVLIPAENEEGEEYKFGEVINSKLGVFQILDNPRVKAKNKAKKAGIGLYPRYQIIDNYRKQIKISPVNKNSSVLILSLEDAVREKAEDVLDEIIRQYNLDAIKDKSQVSGKTKSFIDERILQVGKDLAIIDNDVEKFKKTNKFTGLPEEVNLILTSFAQNDQKIVELKTQLSLAEWILKQLRLESAKDDVLPPSLGFEDQTISQSILEYNNLILERNRKRENTGPLNPILKQLDTQVESIKGSLLKSLENIRKSIDLQLKELRVEENKIASQVTSIPIKERGFIDIFRQQQIITEFYSYLLKKKEETDLSLAVTVPNAKIIDSAYSSKIPVAPKKKIIYLAAMILGLLIPFAIIYIKELLDTKVHTKSDIEDQLSIPFLGDIPKNTTNDKVVIGMDVRSSSAEAFRLIRTNLDFMLASNRNESKSIFITSTTSGEGKSFISINLAATLALSDKKVLLMGMDLRAPKVTEYLGIPDRKGVTNYITDDSLTLDDIIFNIPEVKGLDIIASGVVPPNPAELLMTKRIDNLFTIVKEDYDFVIVDTAPVNLVTDTLLISKYADMFVYTVRANYLDKRLLTVPKNLYNEKRLPNMAIVLNDTDPKKSYGYGYGGYGYGYVVVEKPWYKKIFDRS